MEVGKRGASSSIGEKEYAFRYVKLISNNYCSLEKLSSLAQSQH